MWERKTKIFSVSVAPSQHQKLQRVAQAMGCKQSTVIGWLIDRLEMPESSPIDLTQNKTATQSLGGRGSGFGD